MDDVGPELSEAACKPQDTLHPPARAECLERYTEFLRERGEGPRLACAHDATVETPRVALSREVDGHSLKAANVCGEQDVDNSDPGGGHGGMVPRPSYVTDTPQAG